MYCGLSEPLDLQAGNSPEVAHIGRQHREVERESRRTDEQVREWNNDAFTLLLSVELSSQQSRLFRVRINRQVRQQFAQDGLTAKPDLRCGSAIDTVHNFG